MTMKYQTINQKRYLPDGRCLSRIVAKRDFGNIKMGTLGGFIEDTHNLSQYGECWIGEKAAVYGLARVNKDAVIRGYAVLKDHAIATDHAVIEGHALLDQHVFVGEHAYIGNSSYLSGVTTVVGNARLYCNGFRSLSGKTLMPNTSGLVRIKDFAFLEGRVSIRDHALIAGHCKIIGRVRVIENAMIAGEAEIRGRSLVSGSAHVIQNACICDQTIIIGNALITGHTILGGKSLVTCNAIVRIDGQINDKIFSGDQYVTTRNGWLHINPPDNVLRTRRANATA